MKSFQDASGQNWDVQITLHEAQLVRQRLGLVIVPLLAEDGRPTARDGDDPKKSTGPSRLDTDLDRLYADIGLFGQLLWTLCEKQAEGRGLSPEQFAGRFDLDSFLQARDAVNEEITLFILPRSQKDLARALMQKQVLEANQHLRAGQDRAMKTLASSNSPSNSPASSASIPNT